MIVAASPVCRRGMDGTEPGWKTNFACGVTWPPVAKPGTGICRDVHPCHICARTDGKLRSPAVTPGQPERRPIWACAG